MAQQAPQKDAMDVLQAWVDDYNARAQPAIPLGSAGEAGGAQLRLRYSLAAGEVSIFHMVAVRRNGRPAILVRRFDGPTPDTAVQAGLWASTELAPSIGVHSSANDINEPGEIVGGGDTGFGDFHAFLLSEGLSIDLGTLGGNESEALALNRLAQVAGHSRVRGAGAGALAKHA